ncbi:head GIN domain-containing protein [Arenibacter echinorum]|uniref:Putative autotransporter adhesin-like protein n=1 Tax=Arenibacter echinorum TaxID=440515 RepID=A0A327RG44_9FLAO|nr:head GIN domain-containing protein [Arenibacter echinorum]RAJ15956.1 putative autotransporter adhesin-like protein [Arenibacter echinorum]
MKTKSIGIGLILLCSLILSCDHEVIRVRGDITTREESFSGYSALKVSDPFNTYVRFSDTEEKIEIEANDNLHDNIIVEMVDGTLRIRLKNHTIIRGNPTLNAYIVTKRITDFDLSGASKLSLESELVASDVSIELSGASEFTGELNLEQLDLEASGAADIDLFGQVDKLDVSLSGASNLKNYDLSVKALDIRLSGASDAYLSVTETIDIDASGASKLRYKGSPIIVKSKLSGASEIIKKL